MLITEKDVGRKVRLRDGEEHVIEEFNYSNYPVVLSNQQCYTEDGFYHDRVRTTELDIVEFVDDVDSLKTFEQKLEELIPECPEYDFEDNGQFIQKVPSAESNAKRFLNMLKAQGIYELVVVTDIGEVRCKLNRDRQGED